jgi:predicted transposase YbfD/YdcC
VPGYIDWPGAAQICRITRERTVKGKTSVEVVHAITSLPRRRAGAAELLALARDHWSIENLLHGHRDVALGEDACRTRRRNGPQTLAALRNACLTVMRRFGLRPVEALEQFAENRSQALDMIHRRLPKPRRPKRTSIRYDEKLRGDLPVENTPPLRIIISKQ